MRAPAPLTTLALLSLVAWTPALAQETVRLTAAPEQWTAAAALRPAAMVQVASEPRVEARALVRSARSGRSLGQVLMIVGGAGIVTGLIVDEPIITIAGAGVGGYGLYLYLR